MTGMKRKRAPRVSWTNRDNALAVKQGWAIFECSSGSYPHAEDYAAATDPRLQRDNDVAAFAFDDDAWRYVRHTAENGNPLSRKVLAFLRAVNPTHFRAVMGLDVDLDGTCCDLCKSRAASARAGRCYDCDKGYDHEK